MNRLRRLVREVHRRSLWQVLSVYLIGSWGALQAVEGITENAGLPDWVAPFALVLLILGLPIVLATAIVQEGAPGQSASREGEGAAPAPAAAASANLARGTGSLDLPSTRPSFLARHLTWRRAILGGVAAFALLGFAVASYFAMRFSGVGPVASLVAQGVFDNREPVVLADFANTTGDETLGRMVTEALRVDLVESSALTVLPEAYVQEALGRMGRDADVPLTPELAREMALRDGIKAVVQGEVGQVGSGFVLTASLLEASSGRVLAGYRETASSDDALLGAIDKLSERIRAKAGESLRTIRGGESLESVTTSSLDALKAYTEALRRFSTGDEEGAIVLLESAVERDPEFAMAWRKLGVGLRNRGLDPERQRTAIARAYELRERLSNVERWLTEAYYFTYGEADEARAVQAYERVLEVHPDEPTALNNLAILLPRRGQAARGVELLERAVNGPGAMFVAHSNLLQRYWAQRRLEDAESLVAKIESRYEGSPRPAALRANLLSIQGRHAEAHAARDSLVRSLPPSSSFRHQVELQQASEDVGMGRVGEARAHLETALRMARDAGQEAWEQDDRVRLAWMEAFVAGNRGRAEAALEGVPVDAPAEVTEWTLGTAIAARAFVDPRRARTAVDAWIAAVPESGRTRDVRAAMDFALWAVGLNDGRPDEAMEAMDRIQREFVDCTAGRCWGHAERGMALAAMGRAEEAVAAYLLHLDGLGLTEVGWAPTLTPVVLERLGALQEEAGDAAGAALTWTRLAELWADADAELQPRVRRARERARALAGG